MAQNKNALHILVIEDSDAKFAKLRNLINAGLEGAVIVRAPTVNEAELKIEERNWDGILLDISMDITSSKKGPKLGGHATLGGLSIATKMFLLGREAPTIIVTAFDSFETFDGKRREYSIGLEEIERQGKELLGNSLLGCVRYGNPDWETLLQSLLERFAHD